MKINSLVTGVVTGIIGIIIIFLLVGNTAGSITDASDNISTSGLPLASLFNSSGVVLLVFMAGIMLAVIGIAMGFGKFGKH